MRALVWKELRENLKWALLAMVALGVALTYALYPNSEGLPTYSSWGDGLTLCRKSFLMVTTFGCPAIGMLFGFLQILPEQKGDRWASLLHRPVSRGTIFLGKALSGLLLYGLATVPPFLFAVNLTATPGRFAVPFIPAMAQPGVADILTGVVYYFAALAVALQCGGWAGTKGFPLLAALFVSYFVISSRLFFVAVEAAVIMSGALMVAGWGIIQSPERLNGRPWLGRIAFLAIIFYGVCGLAELAKSLVKEVGPTPRRENVSYVISREGIPVKVTSVNGVPVSAVDVDGKPFVHPEYQPERIRNQATSVMQVSPFIGDSHGWKRSEPRNDYRASNTYLQTLNAYTYPRLEQWFYDLKQPMLLSYLPQSKAAVDRLDLRGFQPLTAPPVPFPSNWVFGTLGDAKAFFWNPAEVRFYDLARRQELPLALPESGPFYGVATLWASSTNGGSTIFLGVALSTELAVFDDKGQLFARLPYRSIDLDRWGQVSLGINAARDRFFVWYKPSLWLDGNTRKGMPSYVEVRDRQGQQLSVTTLPPLADVKSPTDWISSLSRRLQSPAFFFGHMLYRKIGAELGSPRLRNELNHQWGADYSQTRETSLWVVSLAVLLAALTFAGGRRAQLSTPECLAWSVFVLCFGPAGWITFWLAADWPRSVKCADCSARRRIDRFDCPSCHADWPVDRLRGTEIFDRAPLPATSSTGYQAHQS